MDSEAAKLRRHVRILFDIAQLAAENLALERFLDLTTVQVARAVEIDHVKILRYRKATSDLLMEAGIGWREGAVGSATFPMDLRSPPGVAYQTGEPLVIEDYKLAPEYTLSGILKEHGIVALANVPILIGGAAWGVLEVDSTVQRDFRLDSIEFMEAVAAIIGIAVQRQADKLSEVEAASTIAAQSQAHHVLLREMQHRAKNNFQIIMASISLQKRRITGPDVHRALDHVANRINAISIAHDQLAPRDDAQTVDVASYLRALAASIEQQTEGVSLEVTADDVELSISRAVPLGLILNEAAVNSVKHAFGVEGGHIHVKLTSGVGYGEAKITISDNGRGFKDPKPGGSGLRLIDALVRQISGSLEHTSSEHGTTISVTFPVIG